MHLGQLLWEEAAKQCSEPRLVMSCHFLFFGLGFIHLKKCWNVRRIPPQTCQAGLTTLSAPSLSRHYTTMTHYASLCCFIALSLQSGCTERSKMSTVIAHPWTQVWQQLANDNEEMVGVGLKIELIELAFQCKRKSMQAPDDLVQICANPNCWLHPISSYIILYHPISSYIILYHPISSYIYLSFLSLCLQSWVCMGLCRLVVTKNLACNRLYLFLKPSWQRRHRPRDFANKSNPCPSCNDIGTALAHSVGTSSTIPMASSIWPVETDPIHSDHSGVVSLCFAPCHFQYSSIFR